MPLDRKRCAEPASGFCRRTVGSGQFYRYGGRKVRFPVGSKASFRISSAGSPAKFDCCSLSKPGVSYDVCQRCWRRQDIGGQWRISNRHYRYTGIVLYPLFGRLRTRHRGLCPALERHAIWHGAKDNWSPVSMAEYLASAIPGCTSTEIFSGLSHYSCLYHAAPAICRQLNAAS